MGEAARSSPPGDPGSPTAGKTFPRGSPSRKHRSVSIHPEERTGRVLVLASASPRRRDLLAAAGIPHVVRPAQVEEAAPGTAEPAALVEANARRKAEAVARDCPGESVLGADTLVVLDGEALGKPADPDEARRMLRRLSGQVHEVHTGLCLCPASGGPPVVARAVTRVHFRALGEAVIEDYLRRVEVLDKAGAYALQEHGSLLVEQVAGARDNVIGLPLTEVRALLRVHDPALLPPAPCVESGERRDFPGAS